MADSGIFPESCRFAALVERAELAAVYPLACPQPIILTISPAQFSPSEPT